MVDRTIKALLLAIALGLWTHLLWATAMSLSAQRPETLNCTGTIKSDQIIRSLNDIRPITEYKLSLSCQ